MSDWIERYLEDFEAGQTFRFGRLRVDVDRIKSLPLNSIHNRFTSMNEPRPDRYLEVSPRAAGTPPRSP